MNAQFGVCVDQSCVRDDETRPARTGLSARR
jgi:hypothetical protein